MRVTMTPRTRLAELETIAYDEAKRAVDDWLATFTVDGILPKATACLIYDGLVVEAPYIIGLLPSPSYVFASDTFKDPDLVFRYAELFRKNVYTYATQYLDAKGEA